MMIHPSIPVVLWSLAFFVCVAGHFPVYFALPIVVITATWIGTCALVPSGPFDGRRDIPIGVVYLVMVGLIAVAALINPQCHYIGPAPDCPPRITQGKAVGDSALD
jgi:hypothetical protein